jgi:hypothetical protein
MDKSGQGWLVQLMEHVTKLPLVATGPREVLTISFSERADQRVAVFAADFATLVAVSSVNSHSDSPGFEAMWPRPLVGAGGRLGDGSPGAWRCHSRRA